MGTLKEKSSREGKHHRMPDRLDHYEVTGVCRVNRIVRTGGVCHGLKARRWRGECKKCFQGLLSTGNGDLGKSAMATLVKRNLPSVKEYTVG